jgi:hypothetical protein
MTQESSDAAASLLMTMKKQVGECFSLAVNNSIFANDYN